MGKYAKKLKTHSKATVPHSAVDCDQFVHRRHGGLVQVQQFRMNSGTTFYLRYKAGGYSH